MIGNHRLPQRVPVVIKNGTSSSSSLLFVFGGLLLHSQKSLQRIYDLRVSCKADWKEIPLDYKTSPFLSRLGDPSLWVFVFVLFFHYP